MKLRRLLTAPTLCTAVLWAGAPGAGAHDDVGAIAVVNATPTAALTMAYEVDVTYSNDGHAALDATVTLVAERPGQVVGPEVMAATAQPGRYRATVTFPEGGVWELRFSSLSPLASAARAEQLAAPTSPTSAATDTSSASATAAPPTTGSGGAGGASGGAAGGGATAGAAGERDAAGASGSEAAAGAGDGSDDGAPVGLLIGLGLVVVAAVGAAGWLLARRRAAPR